MNDLDESQYKFTSWEKALYEKYPDDIEGWLDKCQQFNLNEFIEHHWLEVANAKSEGSLNYQWENLRKSLACAEEAIKCGEIKQISMSFFNLGKSTEELKHPQDLELKHTLELYNKTDKHIQTLKSWRNDFEEMRKRYAASKNADNKAIKSLESLIDCNKQERYYNNKVLENEAQLEANRIELEALEAKIEAQKDEIEQQIFRKERGKEGARESNKYKNLFTDKMFELFIASDKFPNQSQAIKSMMEELKSYGSDIGYWPSGDDIKLSLKRRLESKIKKEGGIESLKVKDK